MLKNDNHFRANSQQYWGDLYDHLMNTKTFTLITNKIFIQTPIFLRKMDMASIYICLPSGTYCAFHILREFGLIGKTNHSILKWFPTHRLYHLHVAFELILSNHVHLLPQFIKQHQPPPEDSPSIYCCC